MLLSVLVLAACSYTAPQATAPTTDNVAPKTTETTPAPTVAATGTVYNVVIENFKFMPADLQVKVGDTVEWVNKDSAEHIVTFENGDFSEKLPAGGKASFTFTQKGSFGYFCSVHPGMRGVVVVN